MSTAFYESKRKTVAALLTKFGREMVLRDNEAGETFDPATGMVTVGAGVDYKCLGLVYPVNQRKRGNTSELSSSQRAIISAEGLTVEPKTSFQLVVGSTVYEIKSVQPLNPAGVVVLYELEVTR